MELMPQRNLGIPVWGTKSFFRDVEDATPEFRARARNAFIRWRLGVFSKGLNWEKLHNRAGVEFRSIRGSRSIRLLYVERDGGALFFGANLHDYETAETVDLASLVPAGPLESWDPAPGDAEAAIAETESEEGDAPAADPDLLPEDNPFSDPNAVSNDAMLGLGVLWEHIGAVRNLKDGVALLEMFERHRNVLPEKELMALFDSPRRTTLQRLLLARRRAGLAAPPEDVDGGRPEDLDYWRAASLRSFRAWLSPDQQDAVLARSPGTTVVLGAAGTGKTAVALYRASFLARAVFDAPGDRVLLTTFSTTLAEDLAHRLDDVCDDPDVRARIDVLAVNDAVAAFLRANGVEADLGFDRFKDYNARAEALMRRAAAEAGYTGVRRAGWLRQEHEMAVEGAAIRRESDYVGRVLPGPGTKPDDAEKKKLWPVFRRFEALAEAEGFWTPGRAANLAVRMLGGGTAAPATRYAAAVADETQDLAPPHLRFLAAVVGDAPGRPRPDGLTFVGDARQRIYDHGGSLRSAGIDVCDVRRLVRNYRSTEEIRLRAERFLEGVPFDDLDGDLVVRAPSPAARRGPPVEEFRCADDAEEAEKIAEAVRRWMEEDSRQPGSPARQHGEYAVLSPSKKRVDLLCAALEKAGLPAVAVSAGETPGDPGRVRVMTMHRAKGLEYQGVALDLDAQNWPMSPHQARTLPSEEIVRRERRARCLAYAALTRAIRRALVTGVGPAPEGV